jgi:hypothetical protein
MSTAAAGAIATIVASTATKTVYQLRFLVTESQMDLQVMAGGDFDGDLNMLSFSKAFVALLKRWRRILLPGKWWRRLCPGNLASCHKKTRELPNTGSIFPRK